jgi:DNA recombination protein RmuC
LDVKTSLKDYVNYIQTKDEKFLKAHILSLKNHIKKLSEKNYEKLINGLDFVLMFIPIENALLLALQNDDSLFDFALKNKIILVSPTTLFVVLKIIFNSWQVKRQEESVKEIIFLAESLYEKFSLFLEEFDKV